MITTSYDPLQYSGNDSTKDFAITWDYFVPSDIVVKLRTDATGEEVLQTLTTHYSTTTPDPAPGTGTLTFVTAPASGETVVIERASTLTQEIDYTESGSFPHDSHEQGLDRLLLHIQELESELDRVAKFPAGDPASSIDDLPSSVARISGYSGYDSDGKPTVYAAAVSTTGVSTFMVDVLDDADAATARATLDAQEDVITTRGDIIRGSSGNVAERLARGARGNVLITDADDAKWLTIGNARDVIKSDGTDLAWGAPWDENYIINGCCRVGQRGAATLTDGNWFFGKVDRMEGMVDAVTSLDAGTLDQATAAAVGTTGYAAHFNGISTTGNASLYLRTRIEHKDAVRFIDGPATFQCKVRHDFGFGVSFTITVRKATVADDFTSTTEIDNDGGTTVASGTNTTLEFTISDMASCGNGIEIEISFTSTALSSKNAWITEMQLAPRLSAPDFSWRSIDDEEMRCKRYYQRYGDATAETPRLSGNQWNGTEMACSWALYPAMRVAPTVTKNGATWDVVNCGAEPTFGASAKLMWMQLNTTQNQAVSSAWPNDATDYVELDAEL
jgi:hypothetical protein